MERLTLDELCSQIEARVLPKRGCMGWHSVADTLKERISDLENVLGAIDGTRSIKLIALEAKAKKPLSSKAHNRYVKTWWLAVLELQITVMLPVPVISAHVHHALHSDRCPNPHPPAHSRSSTCSNGLEWWKRHQRLLRRVC